jgi:hypothetical protein
VTVYKCLLTRGYFPKELPPAFFTEQFAKFATTKKGRSALAAYTPADNFTECLKYRLALPSHDRRELRVPHPASFAKLAILASKNFSRLLKLASSSGFSKSRPIYATGRQRAIFPMVKPSNLSRERAAIRAGSSYLLKTDISQFYPSLYTHAVGWAVDPKLRKKAHWSNRRLLGKKLDQALMDLDGKMSQGVPIGNDISFLLAEVVLAQVDKALRISSTHSYRWFDDYEVALDTSDQAEEVLKKLSKELGKFRLRLNAKKTLIIRLPRPAEEEWQEALKQAGNARFTTPHDMVRYFDVAFRLRAQYPDLSVLLYALGLLFKVACPPADVGRIAQSCITQCVLCEPGAAQKAFALLTFWRLNGLALDANLMTDTINQMIVRHQASGFSSDIAWALSFCVDSKYSLNSKAAQVLSVFDDDCNALQALHMERLGLLPKGFSSKRIAKALKDADLDREHWLIAYETVRHGLLSVCESSVKSNPLFSELLKHKITFYRSDLPSYAAVIHPGGAADWVVRSWIAHLTGKLESAAVVNYEKILPILDLINADLKKLGRTDVSPEDTLVDLLDSLSPEAEISEDGYSV